MNLNMSIDNISIPILLFDLDWEDTGSTHRERRWEGGEGVDLPPSCFSPPPRNSSALCPAATAALRICPASSAALLLCPAAACLC